MNSISIIYTGGESYYLELGKDDYYTAQPEPEGIFLGEGAKTLKIAGQQIKENDPVLKNLFEGKSPDGSTSLRQGMNRIREYNLLVNPETKEPVRRADNNRPIYLNRFEANQIKNGNPDHYSKRLTKLLKEYQIDDPEKWLTTEKHRSVIGFDNVFSAPKDVSILWALAPTQRDRDKIMGLHERAVRSALGYLEEHTTIRSGKQGVKTEKAKAVFATFTHTTSRDLDPQLHTHGLMLNLGIGKEKTGTLTNGTVLQARYASGMVYQNELRRGIEQVYGVKTYDQPFQKGKGVSFGIVGISQETKDSFSNRHRNIQQRIDPGMTAKQKRAEVLKTRKPKDKSVDSKALLKQWQARGREQGFRWDKVIGQQHSQDIKSKTDYRLFYREVAYRISEQEKRGVAVRDHHVATAVHTASRGKFGASEARNLVAGFKKQLLKAHPQKNGKKAYTLNDLGKKALNYRTIYEKAAHILKELGKAQYKNRMLFLYATGKISGRDYKRYTEGKGLPTSTIGIRVYEALGFVSKKQANYLISRQQQLKLQDTQKQQQGSRKPQKAFRHVPITKMTNFEQRGRSSSSREQER
ncbi:MAG: relaxase domain-containing protein [Symploca sp. SIO2B6]|nr:relaxase domain-containing protein [Symploca sp. SIO2B6]